MFARDFVITPLNETLRLVSGLYGWGYADLEQTLWRHGYSAAQPWIITYDEAIDRQGRDADYLLYSLGMFHPNERGHYAMAQEMSRAAFGKSFENILRRDLAVESISKEIAAMPVLRGQTATTTVQVRFTHDVDSRTFTEEDVLIIGPDGGIVEIVSVRPVQTIQTISRFANELPGAANRFEIVFNRTSLGEHNIMIGPDITGQDGRKFDQDQNDIDWISGNSDNDKPFLDSFKVLYFDKFANPYAK